MSRRLWPACLLPCLALAAPAAAPPAVTSRLDADGQPLPEAALARLGTARFRFGPNVRALDLCPDGRTLAVALPGAGAGVALIDVATGKERRRLAVSPGASYLAFSNDGKTLLTTYYSGAVNVWDAQTGRPAGSVGGPRGRAGELVVSSDGSTIVVCPTFPGREPAAITVYEAAGGKQLATLKTIHNNRVGAAASRDGKLLVSWGNFMPTGPGRLNAEERRKVTETLQVWDVKAGKEKQKLLTGEPGTQAAALSPDGKTLVVATQASSLQFWDLVKGSRTRTLQARRGVGSYLAFSPDGKTLVAAARQGQGGPAQTWEVATGRRLPTPAGPRRQSFVRAAFAGNRILGCGLDGSAVVIWDLQTGRPLAPQLGHTARVGGLAFAPGGSVVVTAGEDGFLIDWDLQGRELRRRSPPDEPEELRRFERENGFVFSPGLKYVVGATRYSGFRLREAAGLEEQFSGPCIGGTEGQAFAFSPDGALLAVAVQGAPRAGRPSPAVRLWRVATGEALPAVESRGPVGGLAFSPDGRSLAVGAQAQDLAARSRHFEVRRVDVGTGKDLPGFTPARLGGGYGPQRVAFAPDGRVIAAADRQGLVSLLDARTGATAKTLEVKEPIVAGPVFSPDGRCLAVGSIRNDGSGGSLSLWEVGTGGRRRTLRPGASPAALAFSADGQLLASGHADSTALVWDVSGARLGRRGPLGNDQLEALWSDLGGDAEGAYAAMRELTARPAHAVALAGKHLKPVAGKGPSAADIARLVKGLDDDSFKVREAAHAELARAGKAAEPALEKALAGEPSAELKRRARELLAAVRRPGLSAEMVRASRALEVLEWLGDAGARRVLLGLARGRAGHSLTEEAAATLARLDRRAGRP
jgi:WD40 repeat protein